MNRALVIAIVALLLAGCSSGGTSSSGTSGSQVASVSSSPAVNAAPVSAVVPSSTTTATAAKIAATAPTGERGPSDANGNAARPKVTASFTQPIQTNKWWSSLIWQYYPGNPYSENLYAHPLAFHAFADGLGVGYPNTPTIGNSGKSYEYAYLEDLRVGVPGLSAPDARVARYSDWTVTASVDDGARRLLATIGHGLPYAYFEVGGGDGQVVCAATPVVWSNNAEVVGLTVHGRHYGLFAPSGSAWTVSGGTLRSTLAGKAWFSVAVLPDNTAATLEFYRQRAYAWVDGTTVSWAYDEAAGTVSATYSAHTTVKEAGHLDHTLLALYRHHWMRTDSLLTGYTYASPRGQMKVLDANTFVLRIPFTGVLPNLPDMGTTDRARLYAYVDQVYQEQLAGPLPNSDTYFIGKAMARLAHLVPIADQVGHTRARDLFLARIQAKLDDFFDGAAPNVFAYNAGWNALIGYPASFGSDTQLNDHHFHYGYFVMAAATLARYNPAWAAANADTVRELVADVGNSDRTATRYPFLRYYDPYAGHGWASGPAPFAAGNNQESSSESIDFTSALILWSSITGDKTLRDEGIFLYATEIDAIHQYWFDEDRTVFPSGYIAPTAGMIWSNGASYSTWWTANPEEIHGINFLPVQPGELHLGRRPDYVLRNHDFLVLQNGGPEQEWRDIIWSFLVFADTSVMTKFLAATYAPEGGETLAHTYHWLWNIAALGTPTATVTASIPTFAVFDKGGVRTYVAWNASDASQTVRFSDGATLVLGARAMATQVGATAPTPTPTPAPSPSATPVASPTPTPSPSPSATPTPSTTSNLLYVMHGGSLSATPGTAVQTDTVAAANGRNYDGTPNQPQVYVLRNLSGTWRSGQSTRFHLYVDAGRNVGDGPQARVSYDFDGDGTYDRVETFTYFATNDLPGFEDYTELRGVRSVSGTYRDMRGGAVKVEVWNAIGQTATMLRTDASASDGQQSVVTLPFDMGGNPTPTPTPTPTPSPTPGPATASTLYLQSGGSLTATAGTSVQADVIPAAGGVNHDGTPYNPIVYLVRGVSGTWRADLTTRFRLYVDAGAKVADGVQVRVSYDFEGDGTYDRVETYNYFATNDVVNWEAYDQTRGLKSASGAFRDFTNATVKVEVWCAIGRDPVSLRTSATAAQGMQSMVQLPMQ